MRIFDLHSDLFTDIAWRKMAGEKNIFDRIHYPKLKKGGIDSIICVFWVEPKFRHHPYHRFQSILHFVLDDLQDAQHALICDPKQPIEKQNDPEKVRILLGLEGLSFIEVWSGETIKARIENAFSSLQRERIGHAIFAWNEHNFLCTGTGATSSQKKGLTDWGKYAVEQANNYEFLLDVSHLDESSFWDMFQVSQSPLIASHSNAKAICNHERNLTDEQIKAIASRGGVIGLNAHGKFVDKEEPSLDRFIDHAIYIADAVGVEHVAFGFDFLDYLQAYNLGGNSVSAFTKGLEDVTKIPHLLERMRARGFTEKDIQAIGFDNAFNFINCFYKNDSTG